MIFLSLNVSWNLHNVSVVFVFRPSWQCPLCKSNYDSGEIESMLLDIVNRKSMSFVLQDLQCKKCQEVCLLVFGFFSKIWPVLKWRMNVECLQIKRENLSQFCPCAGEYQLLHNSATLIQTLDIFHRVGQRFQLTLLTQTVFQLLEMNR